MPKVKISVIIPTYKPAEYIKDCFNSIKDQTLDKSLFEVIVVLNGCGEPWLSQVERYITEYMVNVNCRLIHTNEAGVSNARNIALDLSEGEYIIFIDDDDYISPNYLEELLENSSCDGVALSDSLYIDDESGDIIENNAHHKRFEAVRYKTSPSLLESRVFFNGPVMKLLHRDIIGKRRFDVRFANGEDSLMMLQISDRIKHIKFTSPKAIYYRRIRNNSATMKHRPRFQIAINTLRLFRQYFLCLLKNPFGYNYPFVMSRFIAGVKSILINK